MPEQAWAVVGSWRGSPKLLAHLARTMDATTDGGGVIIDVHVGRDRETFTSADDFLDQVTAQGLSSFDRVGVHTGSGEARLWLQRRQGGGEAEPDGRDAVLPRAGGVLVVTGDRAKDKCDQVLRASATRCSGRSSAGAYDAHGPRRAGERAGGSRRSRSSGGAATRPT